MLEIAANEPPIIRSLVLKEAAKRHIDAEVTNLAVGDFVWDNEIAIERKTVPDFIHSTWDGRLFTQAADLGQYWKSYIVISGSFKGIEFNPMLRGFTVNRKIESIASILARSKVKIFHVDNRTQFVMALFAIKEKSEKGHKNFIVERHSKTMSRKDPNLALILSIPGVGPSIAQNILEEYPTFFELLRDVKMDRKLRTNVPKEGIIYLKKAAGLK